MPVTFFWGVEQNSNFTFIVNVLDNKIVSITVGEPGLSKTEYVFESFTSSWIVVP
jgi:hypothetical protein